MMLRTLAVVLLASAPVVGSAQTLNVLNIYATGGKSVTNWHGQADLQMIHFEIGRTVTPRTEVAFVFAPASIEQPRSWFGDAYGDGYERVHALSGSMLVRRSFRQQSSTPGFIEIATGPMWANKRVPAATSRFNFISQFGVGIVLNAQTRFPLLIGYRFAHVSNGGYAPRNPGLNISSLMIGTRFKTGAIRTGYRRTPADRRE